jgi:hypothetical protein
MGYATMTAKKGCGKEMKTQGTAAVRASISFPPDVYETLEAIAREKKVSLAWVVREAAERFIAGNWPLFGGPRESRARGQSLSRRTIRDHGAGAVQELAARVVRSQARPRLWIPISASCQGLARAPGHCLPKAPQGHFRPRLFLASARSLCAGTLAKVPARFLAAEAGRKQAGILDEPIPIEAQGVRAETRL